jgi:class 3 adenylate cyclase
MFTKVKKHKQIEIPTTILFADLRGYTQLSQTIDPSRMTELLHCFYDYSSEAIWQNEGIVNKFIGDAVLAIFNFPLVRKNHVQNAVDAAIQLQEKCRDLKDKIGLNDEHKLGVGVGIHTGKCNIGEVGNSYKDFTAIGSIVNLASRLQGAAAACEIVITEDVYKHVENDFPNLQSRVLTLKGIDSPLKSYIIDKNAFPG